MKRMIKPSLFLAFAAVATTPAMARNWESFYVGAQAGYGWMHTYTKAEGMANGVVDPATFNMESTTLKPHGDGAVIGLQVGKNWRNENMVFGLEGDLAWTGLKANKRTGGKLYDGTPVANVYIESEQEIKWLGTLRGRLGYVPSEDWLAYLTVGMAVAKLEGTADLVGIGVNYPSSYDKTKTGVAAGGGVEWNVSGNLSAKAEYLYIRFGGDSRTADPTPANPPYQMHYEWKTTMHLVRVGVNYQF